MFVSEKRELSTGFAQAAARLAELTRGSSLRGLSEHVYNGGVDYLLRVGPLGMMPGASRLVRVRFDEPLCRYGMMTVGLRWEATGVTGALFPALDADIRLQDQDGGSTVELTGSYRPPFGTVGAELDRLMLRTVAAATIRTLLNRIADALEGHRDGVPITGTWSPDAPAAIASAAAPSEPRPPGPAPCSPGATTGG